MDDYTPNPEDIAQNVVPINDPQADADAAFEAAIAGDEWKGKRLPELCIVRRMTFSALGGKLFGNLSPSSVESLQTTGIYPGIDYDVACHLWCRTAPKSDVLKARRLPDWGETKVLEFADKEHLEPGYPEFTEAAKLLVTSFQVWAKARGIFEPAEKGGKKPKKGKPRGK
jgi:hypothetical protein